ncbi:hypothetical protein [Emticicia sp. SJ17W-69]|uniref:hypothetical protein n=1 Tax=Emticicia sp. SJ17W-69 TaxID=3421657 RepID=UPI003EBD0582
MENQKERLLKKFKEKKNFDLLASIIIDAIGMATFIVPALGEVADLIIAPIISILIYAVHRTTFGAIAGFLEEIIPFTDIIPTATIIWFYRYILKKNATFEEFISKYSNTKGNQSKRLIEHSL